MPKITFIFILLLLVAMTIKEPVTLTNFAKGSTSSFSEEDKKVRSIYTMVFDNNKNYYGYINIYQLKFNPPPFKLANYYSQLFDIKENFIETDDYYAYFENGKSLYIYKAVNLIRYEDSNISSDNREKINSQVAIIKAKNFFKDNSINLNYEEVLIEYENGFYFISFVERLNNLKNFGLKNNITMDQHGNIIKMEYYYNTYENIGKSKIRSVVDAFYSLPINFDHDEKVYIYNVQLVYIYENSIVQPAYFFQGKFSNGDIFESFVKASIYS